MQEDSINSSPDELAFWSHDFSVVVFIVVVLPTKGSFSIGDLSSAPEAAIVQMIVAGMTFPVYFRLQQQGGPVLLSQIGYVAAAVGLIAATWLLGEQYSLIAWIGATIIALGMVVTLVAQKKD